MSPFKKIACAAALSLSCASFANAAPIVLDFEGVGDLASVNDFYNGGTDSMGNSGTNYGIHFSSTSLGLIDADAGGSGNFANEPTPDTALAFLSGDAATMNVAAGFTTGFSFFYSSSLAAFVHVYDGLNATGNLLASIALTANSGFCNVGDPTGGFCDWSAIGVSFAGTAYSVDFGGTANQVAFDNITLGRDTPIGPGEVPEPASMALALLGLASLGAARRLRKQG